METIQLVLLVLVLATAAAKKIHNMWGRKRTSITSENVDSTTSRNLPAAHRIPEGRLQNAERGSQQLFDTIYSMAQMSLQNVGITSPTTSVNVNPTPIITHTAPPTTTTVNPTPKITHTTPPTPIITHTTHPTIHPPPNNNNPIINSSTTPPTIQPPPNNNPTLPIVPTAPHEERSFPIPDWTREWVQRQM